MKQSFPEPIAIIGLGCRFPGARSIAEYWRMMCEGVDAITDVPADRWDREAYYDRRPATPGKLITRQGGFVENIDLFDPLFFGLSPREAVYVDPQQRLLLEVGWEAVEDAGLLPSRLKNSQTGVYVGICTQDYTSMQQREFSKLNAYAGTGSGRAAAGRLAHVLGLNGPAFVVDTACSSSLVAVHLAVEAIRNGECEIAFAGGANAVLLPTVGVAFSQAGMLSPDARCKAFDENANGFVRSEGAGLVVLQPLSRALAENHRIYAVIRGTAINNDGSHSTFMMPAREGQEAVLRQAYERAGVSPAEVQFVEAHGTGTRVGDPIEIAALNAVLGEGRPKSQICRLGAGKTNIGHTEGAAGVAGLIKTALCLYHRAIPPNLHCHTLNATIPWEDIPFVVQTKLTPWPEYGRLARAGINSFGISGTNAHAVLEEAPAAARRPEEIAGEARVLPLSAKSPEALRASVQAFVDFLGCPGESPSVRDICYTASCGRAHHEYRLAVGGDSRESLRSRLEELLHDGAIGAAVGPLRPVWVFSGVGSQWVGMGRSLAAREPVFRDVFLRCDAAIRLATGWSVLEEIEAPAATSRLDRIDIMQPAIFSVQVALAALWRSWGIEPAAIVGHSLGEFAAAYVAGALTLEDAALAVSVRGALMHRASGKGRMLAVELTWDEARQAIEDCADRVSVAAWNSRSSTVLSGDAEALERIRERLEKREIFARWLKVDVACHSRQMDALRAELVDALQAVEPRATTLPLYSSVTASPITGNALDAEYWAGNMCQPVLFAPVLDSLLAEGHSVFLEVSPHPLLQMPMKLGAQDANREVRVLPSLRREDNTNVLLESLGALYTLGADVHWSAFYPDGGQLVSLPTYQWQRERYWCEEPRGERRFEANGRHPLLQVHWESAQHPGTHFWETELDLERLPYLNDHRLQGIPLVPAAVYTSMVLAASLEIFKPGPRVLRNVELLKALFLAPGEIKRLQLAMWPEGGAARFSIFCRQGESASGPEPWTEHVRGQLEYDSPALTRRDPPDLSLEGLRTAFPDEMSAQQIYASAASAGLDYGPSLWANRRAWVRDTETVAEIQIPNTTAGDSPHDLYHPALLDAMTQSSYAGRVETHGRVRIPVEIPVLEIHRPLKPHEGLWVHSNKRLFSGGRAELETYVYDRAGQLVARDVRVSRIIDRNTPEQDPAAGWLFEPQWEPKPLTEGRERTRGSWRMVGDEDGLGKQVTSLLSAESGSGEGIVYLAALETPAGETPAQANQRICGGALRLVQEIAERNGSTPPRLWLVTRGAHKVLPEDLVALAQTPLVGMARVIANEYPQLRVTRVDLAPEASASDVETLASELLFGDDEPEIAIRGTHRYVLRLERLSADNARPVPRRTIALDASSNSSCQLESTGPGMLDHLTMRAVERRPPGPGEIEIQVLAAGLNFLDVLRALNMLPPEAVGPAIYGMECCGRVVSLGADVEQFQVGDEVIVRDSRNGCFRAFLTTSAAAAWPKPEHLSVEEAATMPVAYQTAYYALHDLARIRKGEAVLIHSAAGGVGLAAVEIARQAGAEIFATAGSPAKRDYLRSLGVRHVFDSRTLDFAGAILEATGGRGVDIALNSLAGEAIPRTLQILATGGRFLEIGKRDIYGNTQLGLFPFQKNLSFFAVDLLRMSWERPDVVESLTREIGERVGNGTFPALPYKSFSIRDVVDAFHYMAQGKHIGKIVVRFDQAELEVEAPAPVGIRADATYLITGGFGDLGLACAEFLAEKGARHLVLVGRRGMIPEAEAAIAALRAQGVEVLAKAADVSKREEVRCLLSEIRRALPPLRGVIHAAGILRDGVVSQMDWPQFEAVFPAKADGAWNLHAELTRPLRAGPGTAGMGTAGAAEIDFFVLFSSATAVLGTPGQGNYAAANAFLDGLAQYRQSLGLPACSIGWGAWSEIGMAARLGAGGPLARAGVGSISPRDGVRILERLLWHGAAHVAVLPIDWKHWAARASEIRNPLFARFADGVDPAVVPGAKTRALADSILEEEDPTQARRLLEDFVRAQASAVLRMAESKLDPRVGLDRLGIDSLMAVELKNRIERELPLTISVVTLLKGPSVSDLATALHGELEVLAESLAAVSGMSDEKVADLLAGMP